MISDTQKYEVEAEFGKLLELNEKANKVIFFNEQGFAKLYQLVANPVYIPEENTFYAYEARIGLWQSQPLVFALHSEDSGCIEMPKNNDILPTKITSEERRSASVKFHPTE